MRKYFTLVLLVVLALVTMLINQSPYLIEEYYSTGLYKIISRTERWLLGWLPLSIGDLLYTGAILWIIIRVVQFVRRWRQKKLSPAIMLVYAKRLLQVCIGIYILFHWLWGFNYNRLGSAYQLRLNREQYSNEELKRLTDTLHFRMLQYMNDTAAYYPFQHLGTLTQESKAAYQAAAGKFPFLQLTYISVKPHMLFTAGNYLGFMGYLNPFTGEAQMNTTMPLVLKPAVLCHEMGHQLGYASESEANFIAFLSCRESRNPAFRYSIYYDMYDYAIRNLYARDSTTARGLLDSLPPKIQNDRLAVRQFFRRYKNPVSPFIDWFYDKYLKLNSQPSGRESYSEVVGWMIAYARKYGWKEI